ncbi:UDP-N-acetylglucosamine 2-epimerase [methane-oxidizing endosymbiont of Gigantopelta aegis]|uniref:UDP-N-acetylglucosamine 2-epimerase n=1 Tax=methane-oxidizing endosymbiont of Gigantopelta aegis TaxID=2794938 RepID=UPI0018DB9995|nr:UDP-N-acetylglucosamine 2-epimerase [methane-oxidizing endosymbiont of Gigantopelta aegis]
MARKICVVTGSRAEYGLLYWLLKEIEQDPALRLQLVVTGMHLSPEFGSTWKQIEADGFSIDWKVEMLMSSDTPTAISKSTGLGIIGFADALARLAPDMLLVLGDRFEIFSAVVAALHARIPVAHIHGGELTEGAVDEALRHAISKMAHLHFTATDVYRKRVIQLGESPDRVFNVGALGVDNIQKLSLLPKDILLKKTGFSLKTHNLLITYHPTTLEKSSAEKQLANLLAVLDELPDTQLFFSKPNADADGRIIASMIDQFVAENSDKAVCFDSLGCLKYLSLMRLMDAVVGNSSSGLLEAPSLKVATLNIGDRQKGRIRAASVVDCEPSVSAIRQGLASVMSKIFKRRLETVENPYGGGGAAKKINAIIRTYELDTIVKKQFYDLPRSETDNKN